MRALRLVRYRLSIVVWLVFGRGRAAVGTLLVGVGTRESSADARFGLIDNLRGAAGGVGGGGVDSAEDEDDDDFKRGSLGIGSLDCGILAG
jgi:hypothetical protein